MTLNELKDKYHSFSSSIDPKMKLKSKGYLDIITLYQEKSNTFESEPVMISKVAEDYVKTQDKLYQLTKKEEYRQKAQAGQECIIKYANQSEISRYFVNFHPDDTSLTNYLNYMKEAGYMDRTRYDDFVSAYNLLLL